MLKLGEHPTRAKDDPTKPAFPLLGAIYDDRRIIAYVNEKRQVQFILPESVLGAEKIAAAIALVDGAAEAGHHVVAEPFEMDDYENE